MKRGRWDKASVRRLHADPIPTPEPWGVGSYATAWSEPPDRPRRPNEHVHKAKKRAKR